VSPNALTMRDHKAAVEVIRQRRVKRREYPRRRRRVDHRPLYPRDGFRSLIRFYRNKGNDKALADLLLLDMERFEGIYGGWGSSHDQEGP